VVDVVEAVAVFVAWPSDEELLTAPFACSITTPPLPILLPELSLFGQENPFSASEHFL